MKKVLVVDDTKNIRMMLTRCLELENYEVITAGDGKQAIDILEERAFDLIFLDIKLPELSGTEVLKRIRELGIRTPVIIITAYATVKNAVDCTNMGAVAYVQKPFSVDKIKSVLKELSVAAAACTDQSAISLGSLLRQIKSSLGSGDYSKALELSKKAISADINNPDIYLYISQAYEGLGDRENAGRFNMFYKSYSK